MMGRISSFGASELDERLEPLEKENLRGRHAWRDPVRDARHRGAARQESHPPLSDGFRMTDARMKHGRILDMMHSVADAAAAAPASSFTASIFEAWSSTAGTTSSEGSDAPTPDSLARRRVELAETKDSLERLSHETGGCRSSSRTPTTSPAAWPHSRRSAGFLPARLRAAGVDFLVVESAVSPDRRARETAGAACPIAAGVHRPPLTGPREHAREPHDCRGDVAFAGGEIPNAAQLLFRPVF